MVRMSIARTGKMLLNTVGRGLLDSVFPPCCGLCGSVEVNDDERSLCDGCLLEVGQEMGREYCGRCGAAAVPFGLRDSGCIECEGIRLHFDGVIRVGFYAGKFRELVRAFKYRGREEFMGFLVGNLARRIARSEAYEAIDVMTWVPTCWRHRFKRDCYAPRLVAGAVARRCGFPLARILGRRYGSHQVGQSRAKRQKNVRGKFFVKRRSEVSGLSICLVDDVMTTGATVGECARVLKKAGAKSVYVAVLAKTDPDDTGMAEQQAWL